MTDHLEIALRVPANHPCLAGHFPGNPIVPGVLLLDGVVAALERALGQRVVRLQHVKFAAMLRPEEPARALCDLEGAEAVFRVVVSRGNETVTLASGRLTLLKNPDRLAA